MPEPTNLQRAWVAQRDRIAELEQERDALRVALRPFASVRVQELGDPERPVWKLEKRDGLRAKHFVQARALLDAAEGE